MERRLNQNNVDVPRNIIVFAVFGDVSFGDVFRAPLAKVKSL